MNELQTEIDAILKRLTSGPIKPLTEEEKKYLAQKAAEYEKTGMSYRAWGGIN